MQESLKAIKNRIRGIQSIEKVTSAMQMVSATKLSRLGNILALSRPYFQRSQELLNNVSCGRDLSVYPFFANRPVKEKIALCVVTSDNGLCGSYNANLIRLAREFIGRYEKGKIKLIIIGKKGYNYFKNFYKDDILHTYLGLNGNYSQKASDAIAERLNGIFLSGQADEVHIAYTQFKNALVNRPVVTKFLNLAQEGREKIDYIFEPGLERVLEELIPKYLLAKMRFILLESFTCEHSSRLASMKMATENARDLLHQLVLLRNKVRQANITREIIEIISGVEALKG